jgi:hypothetical protein
VKTEKGNSRQDKNSSEKAEGVAKKDSRDRRTAVRRKIEINNKKEAREKSSQLMLTRKSFQLHRILTDRVVGFCDFVID